MRAAAKQELKQALASSVPGASDLEERIRRATAESDALEDLLFLAQLRKKAAARGLCTTPSETLRVALLGGYTFFPLEEVLRHELALEGVALELHTGEFDNHVAEILGSPGELEAWEPDVVAIVPSPRGVRYGGDLTDSRAAQEACAVQAAEALVGLADRAHARTGADVVLANFALPVTDELGAYRARTLGSDWSFTKRVNLEVGLMAGPHVTLLDVEFLGCQAGIAGTHDPRGWYETRQPGSRSHVVALARELARLLRCLRRPPRKVLVLDLDNTIWGGVIGDDGLEGIELGDTSPRGEAFKDFQRYVKRLRDRGVLLAVASKNDLDRAREPFESHPEMVLGLEDLVAFHASWGPKSESIHRMAEELRLGLDSFVFVDDNPAEIEIVRQFCPEVATVLLSEDPAHHIRRLEEGRYFEPRSITVEDGARTDQYAREAQRRALREQVTDMASYLESLKMEGVITPFELVDVPRIAQLVQKSNQFNLTTRRRSEAEVRALLDEPQRFGFTMRLQDRFGDHGLIAVVVGEIQGDALEIDTWLMSCRVLERQVEEEVLNELFLQAQQRGCGKIRGIYIPTAKNGMVRDLYPRLGFRRSCEDEDRVEFELAGGEFEKRSTPIQVERRTHVH